MKLRLTLLALLLNLIATSSQAQEPFSLNKIFRRQADIVAEKSGLLRLELPPEVIAECRGDLSDLRILEGQGREIPFLLDSLSNESEVEASELMASNITEAKQKEIRKAEYGQPALHQESFDIALPKEFSSNFEWALVFKSNQNNFVRNVEVRSLSDESAYPDFVSSGSIFRLPNIPAEKLRLPLPYTQAKILRITLEGEGDFYVEPQIFFEKHKASPESKRIEAPLQEISRRQEGNKTLIRINKPAGWNFEALKLNSYEYTFQYHVSVFREESGNSEKLGKATLFRLGSEGKPESLELPLSSSLGNILRIEIETQDSSAVQNFSFFALMKQPALVFALPEPNVQGSKVQLLFGGSRAYPPNYDLTPMMSLLKSSSGDTENIREKLKNLPKAQLANLRPNPDFDSKPALEFAMHPGAEIDTRLYQYERKFYANASTDGLSLIALKAEDLAVARPNLADVRIVDEKNRQWPYLLEANQMQESVAFALSVGEIKKGSSTYNLKLSKGALPIHKIELSISKTFFDRPYRLLVNVGKNNETILAQGRLTRNLGETANIFIETPEVRSSEFQLIIEDGDDEALPIQSITTAISLPNLYLAATPGSYKLLLGNSEAEPPQYELAKARELVLRVQGSPVDLQELTANLDYNVKASGKEGMKSQRWLLWGVLVAAVLGLGVYNLRMVKKN